MDLVFVILHYLAIDETEKCIESIKKYTKDCTFHIIVIDNNSENETGNILIKKYKNDILVTIIKNEENLGFAKGNNVGIKYALKEFNPSFIIVLNNDTELIEEDMWLKINNLYEKTKFSVLGPMIYTKDGRFDSNPISKSLISKEELKEKIEYLSKLKKLTEKKIETFYYLYKRLFNINNNSHTDKKRFFKDKEYFQIHENIQLHGSFLVFSKEYFKHFNGFDEGTFLYMEEDVLFLNLQVKGLTSIYYPHIRIFHKEDISTNSIKFTKNSKRLFMYTHLYNSSVYLYELMNKFSYNDKQ